MSMRTWLSQSRAFLDTAGSWDALAEAVKKAVKSSTTNLHEPGRRGTSQAVDGPPSSQALVRTFGASESSIRVKLYRDTHAWCPYCHKVWMQLEEKRIPYQVEKINMRCYGDKKRSFLAKTPRGLLPAIEIDGEFHTESSFIMQLIEDTFPQHRPLLPQKGTPERRDAEQLMQLERGVFGCWLSWLREAESARMRAQFEQAMDATDQVLAQSGGPYFMGKSLTLVDCIFASTLERIAASILYYKGLKVKGGRWAFVNAWFKTMETHESYRASQSDFHTHVHDLPPQIGRCLSSGTAEQKAAADAIDGLCGSWNLPLPPLESSPWEPAVESPEHDRLEAAAAVVHCHEGIVRSASGGTKTESTAADAALRLVVRMLLEGVDSQNAKVSISEDCKGGDALGAATALRWTRDRVCVPRDMSYPAARQLRAHLNCVADVLDPAQKWKGIPIPADMRYDMDPKLFWGAPAL